MRQNTQNLFLKFSIHFSVKISREKLQTNIRKIQSKLLEKFKHSQGPQNLLVKSFAAQLQFTVHIFFFRIAILRKLFDIRFSYKHCNFSRVCLLVKMASKTVTRSIRLSYDVKNTADLGGGYPPKILLDLHNIFT